MPVTKSFGRLSPAVVLWLVARLLGAQASLDVPVGARIRVLPRGEGTWKVGELTGIQTDTIGVLSCQKVERASPREGDEVINSHTTMSGETVYWVRDCHPNLYALKSLDLIQVSNGRRQSLGRAGWGLVFGGMIGLVASYAVATVQVRRCAPNDDMCSLNYLIVPPATVAGLVTGLIVGAVTTGETWQPARYR